MCTLKALFALAVEHTFCAMCALAKLYAISAFCTLCEWAEGKQERSCVCCCKCGVCCTMCCNAAQLVNSPVSFLCATPNMHMWNKYSCKPYFEFLRPSAQICAA